MALLYDDIDCQIILQSQEIIQSIFGSHMPKKVNTEPQQSSQLGPQYYEVQSILDKRVTSKGQEEYLIRWKHYPNPRDYTWEPTQHLLEVKELIQKFNIDYERKKKKKQIQHLKKHQEEEEEQIIVASQLEPEHREEQSSIAQQEPKKRGRKKKEVKEVQEEKRYMPKIINIESLHPKKREKTAKRLQSEDQIQPTHKRKVKDEGGRPISTIALNSDESPPNNPDKWYMNLPYRLGTIYKHVFQGTNVSYMVNVENMDEQLVTMVCVREEEMQKIGKEKMRDYLLNYFYGLSKDSYDNQLENFWAE